MQDKILLFTLLTLGSISSLVFLTTLWLKPEDDSSTTSVKAKVVGKEIDLTFTIRTFTGVFALSFFVMAWYFNRPMPDLVSKVDPVYYITLTPDTTRKGIDIAHLRASYRENIMDTIMQFVKVENGTGGQLRLALKNIKNKDNIFEIIVEDSTQNKKWARRNIPIFNISTDLPFDEK